MPEIFLQRDMIECVTKVCKTIVKKWNKVSKVHPADQLQTLPVPLPTLVIIC
jgi:hypothetical protein